MEVSYIGYALKKIENIEVQASQTTTLNVALEESTSNVLNQVEVKGQLSRETETALLAAQKKGVVFNFQLTDLIPGSCSGNRTSLSGCGLIKD